MGSWNYNLNNPTVLFEVEEKLEETDNRIHLAVKTSDGIKARWIPKKVSDFYQYCKEGSIVQEIIIPEWLAKKIGLCE